MSKSEKRQRTELLLGIRCTPEEKTEILEKAKITGLSTGEFLRRCALNRKIQTWSDQQTVRELTRLGALQKHLFNEGRDTVSASFSKQYADILVTIRDTLLRLGQRSSV